MATQLLLAISGRLDKRYMEAVITAQGRAVQEIVARKTKKFHKTAQSRVRRVLPSRGGRLDKDLDFKIYPRRGASMNATGIVFSKTSVAVKNKRRGRGFDVIQFFNETTPTAVRPNRSGGYLWIPTRFAQGVAGTASNNPRLFGPGKFRDKLQVILSRNKKHGVAILKRSRNRSGRGTVMFVLVKQARVRKKLNLDRSFATSTKSFFPQVEKSFDKHLRRAIQRRR